MAIRLKPYPRGKEVDGVAMSLRPAPYLSPYMPSLGSLCHHSGFHGQLLGGQNGHNLWGKLLAESRGAGSADGAHSCRDESLPKVLGNYKWITGLSGLCRALVVQCSFHDQVVPHSC